MSFAEFASVEGQLNMFNKLSIYIVRMPQRRASVTLHVQITIFQKTR